MWAPAAWNGPTLPRARRFPGPTHCALSSARARHIANLSAYLKERILERPFLSLLTPRGWEDSSGLTSFSVAGHAAGDVSRLLREKWHIYVRVVPHYNALRISTAHFNNEADVDTLMAALDEIGREHD